jgi:hypothetical protein
MTREEISCLINKFLKTNSLLRSACFEICSDGAVALTGIRKGFTARVKAVSPHVILQDCMIHRKPTNPGVSKVLQVAVSVVNFMKVRLINSESF